MLLIGACDVLFVLIAIQQFGTGESGAAILSAAIGAGGILGGMVAFGLIGRQRLAPVLLAIGVAWGLLFLLFGVFVPAVVAPALLVACGIALTLDGRRRSDRAPARRARRGPGPRVRDPRGPDDGVPRRRLDPAAGGRRRVRDPGGRGAFAAVIPLVVVLASPGLRGIDRRANVPVRALALLRRLPLFAGLSPPTLESLARSGVWQSVPPATVVIREGDPGERFFVLETGSLDVSRGGEFVRTLSSPGDGFGEIALLRNVPRTATVTATGGQPAAGDRAHRVPRRGDGTGGGERDGRAGSWTTTSTTIVSCRRATPRRRPRPSRPRADDHHPYNPAVTLILTAMTPNTLVQVSDMRVTNNWTWEVVDETTPKTVVYEGRAMWAFAGPACMGDQPTAVWLASLLAANGPDEIVDAIRRSGDSILRRYPERARRLAVVAAEWQGSNEALVPRYRQVANFDFVTGELWPVMARSMSGSIRVATRRRCSRPASSCLHRSTPRSRVACAVAPAPKRERGGCRGHPGRHVRHAGRATPARREARAHRIDPARTGSAIGRTGRRRAAGRALVMRPFPGCGSAANPSPTGPDRLHRLRGGTRSRRPVHARLRCSRRVHGDRLHGRRRRAVVCCV